MLVHEVDGLRFVALAGDEAREYAGDLMRLRIENFAEYPYLYQGCVEDEEKYFETYFASKNFRVLVVFDGERVCGMCTFIPLRDEAEYMKAPFVKQGLRVEDYLYIGEAILEKEYRGKGLFPHFFDYALGLLKEFGLPRMSVMTIRTEADSPYRPEGYLSTDSLLVKYGFKKIEGIVVKLSYRSVVSGVDEPHVLDFWER